MSTISSLLDQLGQNYLAQVKLASSLTQRQTLAGEIAFHNGETYTPTVADLSTLVNDDPDNRITTQGDQAQALAQNQGRLLISIIKAQKAANVTPNKGPEIMQAAETGNYSKINGA